MRQMLHRSLLVPAFLLVLSAGCASNSHATQASIPAQLMAGGWKSEGKPAIGDGVAVQRFSFRDGQVAWSAVLIIMAEQDQREARLEFTKAL